MIVWAFAAGNEIEPKSKLSDSIVEALFIARLSLFASKTKDVLLLIAKNGPRRARGIVVENRAIYQRRNKDLHGRRQFGSPEPLRNFGEPPKIWGPLQISVFCECSCG